MQGMRVQSLVGELSPTIEAHGPQLKMLQWRHSVAKKNLKNPKPQWDTEYYSLEWL